MIDARGKFVVPGLWDMHAHIAAGGDASAALNAYLPRGVLGIRDMGGDAATVYALKREVQAGSRLGPTIFAAGPTLNGEASGGHHRVSRDAEEARTAVRELRAAGSDFIKIHRRTSPEAFAGVAQETRAQGIQFAGHVPLAMDWITAAARGMRTIEHVQALLENEAVKDGDPVAAAFATMAKIEGDRGADIFRALAGNNVHITPTLAYYEASWAKDPPERKELKQQLFARLKPQVARAAGLGVRILAGTDALNGDGGESLLRELELLVDAGLTPRAALAAATTTPRDLVGGGPGRIAPGEEASLLLVDADPLQDVRNLRRLSAVLLKGRVLPSASGVRQRSQPPSRPE